MADRSFGVGGRYRLVLQDDGNLVLYEGSTPHWHTNTWNLPPFSKPVKAVMQHDGNFVLYSALGQPAWHTNTWEKGGDRLVLQDDRNLVLYRSDNVAVWHTDTWVRSTQPASRAPVSKQQRNEVGWGKFMDTTARLYRNGCLVVSCRTENNNWADGLWGRILVVAVDGQGRAVWVSQVLECTTRCGVPDFSCASFGTDTLEEKFPDVVGPMTDHIDVYQASRGNFVDLRKATIEAIKGVAEIAKTLGPVLALL
jgi:hypothetical protein